MDTFEIDYALYDWVEINRVIKRNADSKVLARKRALERDLEAYNAKYVE